MKIIRSSSTTSLKDLLEESSTYEQAAIKDLPYVCKNILAHYEYFKSDLDLSKS